MPPAVAPVSIASAMISRATSKGEQRAARALHISRAAQRHSPGGRHHRPSEEAVLRLLKA